jgi:hypothetical protein
MNDDCALRQWICAWAKKYPAMHDDVLAPFASRACLSVDDVDVILGWKLGSTPNRLKVARRNIASNPACFVSDIIARAARCNDDLGALLLLCQLKGVKTAIASAILQALRPERFTVYDVRAITSLQALGLFIADPCKGEWLNYLESCRAIARRTGFSLRKVDRALYMANGRTGLPPGTQATSSCCCC